MKKIPNAFLWTRYSFFVENYSKSYALNEFAFFVSGS